MKTKMKTKMKVIKINLDNESWIIPLEFVAKHRADYYKGRAEEKGDEDYNYQEEVDFVMNDDYEGEDWLSNNMNYEDFENMIKIIPNKNKVEVDWCNAEKEIIEIEGDENE